MGKAFFSQLVQDTGNISVQILNEVMQSDLSELTLKMETLIMHFM